MEDQYHRYSFFITQNIQSCSFPEFQFTKGTGSNQETKYKLHSQDKETAKKKRIRIPRFPYDLYVC